MPLQTTIVGSGSPATCHASSASSTEVILPFKSVHSTRPCRGAELPSSTLDRLQPRYECVHRRDRKENPKRRRTHLIGARTVVRTPHPQFYSVPRKPHLLQKGGKNQFTTSSTRLPKSIYSPLEKLIPRVLAGYQLSRSPQVGLLNTTRPAHLQSRLEQLGPQTETGSGPLPRNPP